MKIFDSESIFMAIVTRDHDAARAAANLHLSFIQASLREIGAPGASVSALAGTGTGPITSTTSYDYQAEVAKELARTGLNSVQVWGFGVAGSALILFGAAFVYVARKRKN